MSFAGGGSRVQSLPPTKTTLVSLVIHGLNSHAYLPIFRNGKRLNPRTSTPSKCQFRCSALLSQSGIIFILDFATSEPSSESLLRTEIHAGSTNFFLAVCKVLFCARLMHSTTKFAMLFLSKCVCDLMVSDVIFAYICICCVFAVFANIAACAKL